MRFKSFTTQYLLLLILVLSFFLRLIKLNQSLWLDEAINVLAAKNLPFWQFVTGYPMGDFHPPGYFAILWVWGHTFGFDEVSVRLPSVILGVLTVYLVYLIGRKLFDQKAGLLAAALLATGPLHIYYSQEARMYALSAFSATLCWYLFIKLVKEGKGIFWYGLSLILVFYSDYLTYLIIPAQLLYLTLFDKKSLVKVTQGLLIGLIGLFPWLMVFPSQLKAGTATAQSVQGWKNVVGGATIKNIILVFLKTVIGRISIPNLKIYILAMTPLFVFYGYLLSLTVKVRSWQKWLLLIWFLVPVVVGFIISLFVPVLYYFRLIYIVGAFYLLVASAVNTQKGKNFNILVTVLLTINLICLGVYYIFPQFQREDWRGLSQFLSGQNGPVGVIFEDTRQPAPFEYYYHGYPPTLGGIANFPAQKSADIKQFAEFTTGRDKIFLVDYLVEISDPNRLVDKQLTSLGWKVTNVYNFNGVGFVYEYRR